MDSDTSSSDSGPMVQLGRRRLPNGVVITYQRPSRPEDRQRHRDRLLAMQQRGYPRSIAGIYTIVANQDTGHISLQRANGHRPAQLQPNPELLRLGEQFRLAQAESMKRRKQERTGSVIERPHWLRRGSLYNDSRAHHPPRVCYSERLKPNFTKTGIPAKLQRDFYYALTHEALRQRSTCQRQEPTYPL